MKLTLPHNDEVLSFRAQKKKKKSAEVHRPGSVLYSSIRLDKAKLDRRGVWRVEMG